MPGQHKVYKNDQAVRRAGQALARRQGLDFFERRYPHVTFTFAWGDEENECRWERLNARG